MTEKQKLVARLNELRAQRGEPAMTEKMANKRSIGVIKLNIEAYEREVA